METSILIIGKICSGKSTLAKDISRWLNFPMASFGKYLAEYSKNNSLPINREAFQELGNSFIQKDHSGFLNSVIDFTGNQQKMIFEGVRHNVIFDDISSLSKNTLSIYLDVSEPLRLERFINREKDIDSAIRAEADFHRYNSHPVEKEVDQLKDKCDFVITTKRGYKELLKILSIH
jgi:cytidylate kinase